MNVTQELYNKEYLGPEFSLEKRYSNIMAITFITFIFSSGMPALYPITLCSIIVNYWIDKLLRKLYHYNGDSTESE